MLFCQAAVMLHTLALTKEKSPLLCVTVMDSTSKQNCDVFCPHTEHINLLAGTHTIVCVPVFTLKYTL